MVGQRRRASARNTASTDFGIRITSRHELGERIHSLRAGGDVRTIVLANGCFDLLHAGHVRYLQDARSRGDFLIVALNSDRSVRTIKGPGRPLVPLAERAEIVGALRCVDAVTSFDEADLETTLRVLRPDVHAKGSDYTAASVPEAPINRELGIKIAICGDPKDHSTSELLRRMAQETPDDRGDDRLPRRARLTTRNVRTREDVVRHFDGLALHYRETHGCAEKLLSYRLGIIRRFLGGAQGGTLLEIGCGTAIHLLALAAGFAHAIGTDLSPEMVNVARRHAEGSPWSDRISIRVDPAEELATIEDSSIDVVLCVGALEHMLEKDRVLRQVHRVLQPRGMFIGLTPNGGYCWYRHVAPVLGVDSRHLSTDHFLTAGELDGLLSGAGLEIVARRHWSFVPQGDLPGGWGPMLQVLDWCGRRASIGYLRGGIAVAAIRPDGSTG
jgi:rfaE bifunctional protein nucleotidyltransferase chain/domain